MSTAPAPPGAPRAFNAGESWPYLLLPFIPIGIALELAGVDSTIVFVVSALAIVPTAALMGRATVELAARAGPGIGSLLNATFGNAPELIIALFALNAGLHEVVKASLVGSVLGNILLVLGAAALAGGRRRVSQQFDATAAGVQALILLLAVTALIMPAVFALVGGEGLPLPSEQAINYPSDIDQLSIGVALVLLVGYASALIFSLRTHRDLFNPSFGKEDHLGTPWSVRRSVVMLALAGAVAAVMSEILVGTISEASESIGLSRFFVGIVVVAVISNAAEHWVAVSFALRDKMDISLNITIASSTQIALFAAPLLVLISLFIGPFEMALVFNGLEVVALLLAVLIANHITQEGESSWFEGLQLVAVYLVMATTFAFV
jgi:Ca2+:H+ antiporter